MRAAELEVASHITLQAHIDGKLFTTEAAVAKQVGGSTILRLMNVEQFDKYASKTSIFSLCYKSGLEMNFISSDVEILHSASNPVFISINSEVEMTAIHSQRSHVRYPYGYDLVLSVGMENITAHSVDISSSGVGVISPKPIRVSTTAFVDVYNPVTKKARAFRAQVANCTQKEMNKYFIGLMFYEPDQWVLDFINDLQNKILQEVS